MFRSAVGRRPSGISLRWRTLHSFRLHIYHRIRRPSALAFMPSYMHRLAAGESNCLAARAPSFGDALSSPDLTRESSPNALSRRDVRVHLLWLLAALVGASVAYRYFFRA